MNAPQDASSTSFAGEGVKICILSERMRLGYGVDLVVDQQARGLVSLGFDVTVVVIHADLDLPAVPYRLVVLNRILPPGDYDSEIWAQGALELAQVWQSDVWVLHTPPFYEWARFLPGPVVFVEYGAPPGRFFQLEVGDHIDAMASARLNGLYGTLLQCDAIMSISQSIHEWLPVRARRLSVVSHLGCDHYPRASEAEALALRQSLGMSRDDCIVLWVGRMQVSHDEQPYKGFTELRTLIPLASKHLPQARFILAGRVADSELAQVRALGVTVLPNLEPEELATVYAASDLLINLSRWEGFNLALLEAQYQGTPVLAYDYGPHREIVQSGVTGWLAATEKELFAFMLRIVATGAELKNAGARASEFAQSFSWSRNIVDLEHVIRRCIGAAPEQREIRSLRTAASRRRIQRGPRRREGPVDAIVSDKLGFGPNPAGDGISLLPWSDLGNQAFVQCAYRMLLGRDAEASALAGWVSFLKGGGGREDLLRRIHESAEARQRREQDSLLTRLLQPTVVSDVSGLPPKPVVPLDVVRSSPGEIDISSSRIADSLRDVVSELKRLSEHAPVPVQLPLAPGNQEAEAEAWPSLDPSAPEFPDLGLCDHVVLLSPGIAADVGRLVRALEAAQAHDLDLLYGDELEIADGGARSRRMHGPFSHEHFLASPDLGGAIVVRRRLLADLGLESDVVLTGQIVLLLLERAHTVGHLAALLAKRCKRQGLASRPTERELAQYVGGYAPEATISQVERGRFDVRMRVSPGWRTFLALDLRTEGVEPERLKKLAHTRNIAVGLIGADRVTLRVHSELKSSGIEAAVLPVPNDAALGQRLLAIAAACPSDCDYVGLLDHRLTPENEDWLERLIETAAHPRTGAVGAKILDEKGRVTDAGLSRDDQGSWRGVSRLEWADSASSPSERDWLNALRKTPAISFRCAVMKRATLIDQSRLASPEFPTYVEVEVSTLLENRGLSLFIDGRVGMIEVADRWSWSTWASGESSRVTPRAAGDEAWRPDLVLDGIIRTVRLPHYLDRAS